MELDKLDGYAKYCFSRCGLEQIFNLRQRRGREHRESYLTSSQRTTKLTVFTVASLKGAEGAARPGCHHFGVTPFYDTNQTKTKTNIIFNVVEKI